MIAVYESYVKLSDNTCYGLDSLTGNPLIEPDIVDPEIVSVPVEAGLVPEICIRISYFPFTGANVPSEISSAWTTLVA